MARHCDCDPTLIYESAKLFRDRCLLADGSLLFGEAQFWTLENLQTLHRVFVNAPDESARTFEEKLRDQITPSGQSITRLAAEVIAVHFLFVSNVSAFRKRELVNEVLQWHGDNLPESHQVSRAFATGIGSGGFGYNARRRFELYYLIELGIAWKRLTPEEAKERISDPWKFMDFADGVEGAEGAQLRHMLLYLLFPDHFERIASADHKRRIVRAFRGLAEDSADKEIDRLLYGIRQRLEELLPRDGLDFYWEPLRTAWYSDSDESDSVATLDAIRHKKQIVFYGPPGTGKTHQAKEVAEQLIRAAALEKWGAARFFSEAGALKEVLKTHVRRLQLHPAYSYEDFVRGLHLGEGGRTEYRLGYLLELIGEIEKESERDRLPYVLILDEINRTDLSRLLGECFSLLENRGDTIDLPGRSSSGETMRMRIPPDLYVIGTMNLIDQSIEQIDFALRRRFLWRECPFSASALLRIAEHVWCQESTPYHDWDRVAADFAMLASSATALNAQIVNSAFLGSQYAVGHTYFIDAVHFLRAELHGAGRRRKYLFWGRYGEPTKPLMDLWNLALKPLLREYLSGLEANVRHAELSRLETEFYKRREPSESAA